MGEEFLRILRVNELLGGIEHCLHVRFGEVERLRAGLLGARLQGVCGAFGLRGCLVSGLDERNSALRLCRWVDPHFSNALELDGWVIWGERTLSLPRRSRSRRLQGAGEVSEYPRLRTGGSERKLDAACGLDDARAYLQKFFAQGHKFGDSERMGLGIALTMQHRGRHRRGAFGHVSCWVGVAAWPGTAPRPAHKTDRASFLAILDLVPGRRECSILLRRPARHCEPARREIEPLDEGVDEPNGIVGDDIIVDRLWQQQKLRTFEPGNVSHVRF